MCLGRVDNVGWFFGGDERARMRPLCGVSLGDDRELFELKPGVDCPQRLTELRLQNLQLR